MTSHYDWKNAVHHCAHCGWTGQGREAKVGETFNDGAEYHCPQCDANFGYVEFPLLQETLMDPRAPETDRAFAQIALRSVAEEQTARIVADAQRSARRACEETARVLEAAQAAARKTPEASA